jgi:hypothetical protein
MEFANYQGGCSNEITLLPEGSGVKLACSSAMDRFQRLWFSAVAIVLVGNCMQFKGWAQTSIQLRFDESKQTVYGNVSVDGVNLEGVSPVANSFVTVFVQTAINQRVNPLVLVD